MPDATTDLSALADQVKTLTDQLKLVQKKLAGDLNIQSEQLKRVDEGLSDLNVRFEQLSVKQNTRLSALEGLPRKDFLDFTPQLDGDWAGGTISPEFVIGGEGAQVTAIGNMSVELPDLSKIVMFQYSCEFDIKNEIVPQLIVRLKRKSGSDEVTIVELINDKKDTLVVGFPNLETHLVQNDLFEYLIDAQVNFFSAGAAVIPKGLVALNEFSVGCIAGGV
jgi:hypothetical protein